ncbi:MAG: DUF3795 domain-containing protein [Candidatus Korarchaeota archaeon]|nr:DUF3795 domain-containing protein [Candidatus Korarchaeota archaeon]NIU83680.1 DUF3795 domain-containing protein [Candidatus Thorarchaeota archaeon]NIW12672.1 DUF3795 domain-containing protein [Candidatus Thorarchaeota archaeon]NIW50879.1 DUF3795 domain-containing protein [Candidatus Korarchaeota archaeon]
MKAKKEMISPCGLDCEPCPIRRLSFDETASKEVIDWYKRQGWLKKEEGREEAIKQGMYCKGCRSDRNDVHWSPDCFILECCVDKKNLDFCYECEEFPCDRLIKWSEETEQYQEALENLKRIQKERTQK